MRYLTAAMLVAFSVCFSESMTQTDWYQGPGEILPVTSWQSAFKAGSGLDFGIPGEMRLGTGISLFEVTTVNENAVNPYKVTCADFDGDGDLDIVYNDLDDWSIRLCENLDGAGSQWDHHLIFNYPWPPVRYIQPEDLDDDGDMDMLITSGFYFLYCENTDGSGLNWQQHVLNDDQVTEAFDVICFDIDQDGDKDVVGSASYGNRLYSWENLDGSGNEWQERVISDDHLYAIDLSSCDIDGDGDTDFICVWDWSESVILYENQGAHEWLEREVISSVLNPSRVLTSDFDGDGDFDLALFSQTNRRIYENIDGIGQDWVYHTLPTASGPISFDVGISDVDMDGDMDIHGSTNKPYGSPIDASMFIYENLDGTCRQWEYHRFTIPDENLRAFNFSGDIDGDGYLEFPGRKSSSGIVWLDAIGPADTGWVESSILQVTDPAWESVNWSADLPSGTDIDLRLRSSDDWEDMGAWSARIENPGSISGLIDDGDQYVQYMAEITRSQSSQEPRLLDVELTWMLGIEGGESVEPGLFVHSPTSGSVAARVLVNGPSNATLRVFDMTGRVVAERADHPLAEGVNEVYFGEMTPGVYFCRLTAGGMDMTASFVVIE